MSYVSHYSKNMFVNYLIDRVYDVNPEISRVAYVLRISPSERRRLRLRITAPS